MIVDAHCHLYDEKMKEIEEQVFEDIKKGNTSCVLSADTIQHSKMCIELAHKLPNTYATVGIHPHEVENFDDKIIEQLKSLSKDSKVLAIGEIGLDYYYDLNLKDMQFVALNKQIDLANEVKKPCVFHVREAMGDFLEVIRKNKPLYGGLVHSFNGSVEVAKELLAMGFYFSFNGIATFKNANNVLKVIEFLPMDRILIETDSPYLAPVPHRGEINRPSYVRLVAQKVAEIKNISEEFVINQTKENTEKLFGIKFMDIASKA
ncbi:MAG: TatD family hydrolase [Christensenellales bacterium]